MTDTDIRTGRYTSTSTGTDGNGHKIAISGGGGISRDGRLTVSGAGTVLADYSWTVDGGYATCPMPITVTDTATLAVTPDANLGTGKISVASGATLQVALVSNEMSQVTFDHSLNLADGAVLGFTFAEKGFAPFNLTGKTVTCGGAVVVKVAAEHGAHAKSDEYHG